MVVRTAVADPSMVGVAVSGASVAEALAPLVGVTLVVVGVLGGVGGEQGGTRVSVGSGPCSYAAGPSSHDCGLVLMTIASPPTAASKATMMSKMVICDWGRFLSALGLRS